MRVLILTADVGEGHLSAARALARELTLHEGVEPVVADGLAGVGPLLRALIRDGYRLQLRLFPWAYGIVFWSFTRVRPLRALARIGLSLVGGRRLLAFVRGFEPDIVVSTFPAVTSVLGGLRRRGRLRIPSCALITDLAVHALWADPGIDLHLVVHERCVPPVERVAGPGSARQMRPPVSPEFLDPPPRQESRSSLGLPSDGTVILVSGGGWGVGDLEGAVRCSLRFRSAIVVCLAGRDDTVRRTLEQTFAREPRVRVWGFTDRMSDLLAASDAVVHTTGGVTCLEALTVGCPVVAYGAAPGHGRANAKALAALGLGEAACRRGDLVPALGRVLARRGPFLGSLASAPAAGSLVVAAVQRARPLPRWRLGLARVAVAGAATVLVGGWAFASDDPYQLVSRGLHLRPVTRIRTRQPEIALVIRAPAVLSTRIADRLRAAHVRASFAFARPPSPRVVAALARQGDETLPELGGGGLTYWLATRESLELDRRSLGLSDRFFYLAPRDGFTLGQYLFGRSIGGRPIAAAVSLAAAGRIQGPLLHGQIVVLTVGQRHALRSVDDLLGVLRSERLAAAPVRALAAPPSGRELTAAVAPSTAPPARTAVSETSSTPARPLEAQCSPTSIGARITGTPVCTTKTSGATRVAGRVCSAVISLSVPRNPASAVAPAASTSPTHAHVET